MAIIYSYVVHFSSLSLPGCNLIPETNSILIYVPPKKKEKRKRKVKNWNASISRVNWYIHSLARMKIAREIVGIESIL